MSSKNEDDTMYEDGIMYVTLAAYLRGLRFIENRKPKEERLGVPTMKKLAEAVGVHPSMISRMAYGHTSSLNMNVCASIITQMRRRGFKTEITDILKFEMPEDLKDSKGESNDPRTPPPPPLTRRQRLKYPGDEFVKAYAESESTQQEAA